MATFLSCAVSSLGASWLSSHLLLLSRRILQSVLGRPAGLHSGRTAQELLGRAVVPAHYAECASIFSLFGTFLSDRARDRCLESGLVSKWIWNWRWHNRAGNQCCFARGLHVWLSLVAAFGWRIFRSIFQVANMLPCVRLRDLFQSSPHAVGVVESVLGPFFGSLRAPVRNGNLARFQNRLSDEARCVEAD